MTWLLDTNILSEPTKRTPSETVMGWVQAQEAAALHTHSLVLAELRRGVEPIAATDWGQRLSEWLDDIVRPLFAGRILESDEATWSAMFRIMARARAIGRAPPVADLILAAAAERHGLVIVTRNVRDFVGTGVRVLNPWRTDPVIETA